MGIDIMNLTKEQQEILKGLKKERYTDDELEYQKKLMVKQNNIKKYLTEVNETRKTIDYSEILNYIDWNASTGRLCKLMEYRDDLYNWIKELEVKRNKEDLLNKDKYKDLYDMYYNVVNEINKLKNGEN